jgi:hypothetical protein
LAPQVSRQDGPFKLCPEHVLGAAQCSVHLMPFEPTCCQYGHSPNIRANPTCQQLLFKAVHTLHGTGTSVQQYKSAMPALYLTCHTAGVCRAH